MRQVRLATLALLVTTGCSRFHKPTDTVLDQCERQKLFHQCLAGLPAGPQQTKYNDWDDVVSACDSTAMSQSLKPRHAVAAECLLEWP